MPDFRGYTFSNVVNAVTDLGMDDTGGTPISQTLHENVSGGDLVVFPDGDYLCEDGYNWGSQGGDPIGVVAKAAWDVYSGGDTRDPYTDDTVSYDDIYTSNVNFQPKKDGGKITTPRVGKTATMDLIIEGITLDHTNTNDTDNDSGTLGMSTGLIDGESVDIRNVDHAGRAINYSNPGNEELAIGAGTESDTGQVVVHGCELLESHDESLYGNASGRIGFYTGVSHDGAIEYNDCSASEIGNNGWYCSGPADDDPPEGSVVIDDCYVENCSAAGFRISGGESKIVNSEAVYDSTLYDGSHRGTEGGSRPIVLETSNAGTSDSTQQTPGVTVKNTTVTMRDCWKPSMAIHAYQTERAVNIIDCDIDIDGVDMSVTSPNESDAQQGWITRGPYTQAFGTDGPGEDPRQLNLDNTTVTVKNTTTSSEATCVVAAIDADDDRGSQTTGTHIHNGTCIQTSGNEDSLDGVAVEKYSSNYSNFDATVENVTINVSGSTINNIGSNSITTNNIDTSSTCTIGDENPSGGSGTLFADDISDYLDGANLLDSWSTRWNSADSDWSVEKDYDFKSASKLVLDASTRTRRALIWDDVGTPDDVEMAIIATTPDTFGASGGSHIRPIVRGSTNNGEEAGYFVAANDVEWRLISYNGDGTTSKLGSWGTPASGTMYRIRLRANGTDIQARTWEDGTDEPTAWDISITDSTHTTGWAGVGSYEVHDEFGYAGVGVGGETAPIPAIVRGDSVNSLNGICRTVSGIVWNIPERVLDSFEDYTVGNDIDSEATEWGVSTSAAGPLDVSNTVAADGSNSLGWETANDGYFTAQSNTASGNVTNQTATFNRYPYADSTIRCALYIPDTSATLDMAFGVPETEGDFNNNCYRFRGGTGTAPFLRRTETGTSSSLASFTSTLSADTWYDIAVEFQDDSANSNVELSARIWEWDSTNSEWVEFESEISATDTNYVFPSEGGVALAANNAGNSAFFEYFRFSDQLGDNGKPRYTL